MYDYAILEKQALEELELLENNTALQAELNKTLHNNSENTDYESWVKGAEKFAQDNYTVLKEWIY
jgi:hypothetical protein